MRLATSRPQKAPAAAGAAAGHRRTESYSQDSRYTTEKVGGWGTYTTKLSCRIDGHGYQVDTRQVTIVYRSLWNCCQQE